MKKQQFKPKLTVPLLFAVMVLCMGCPYESKFPLTGTKIKYDKNLVGTWHQGETDLKITRVDDYEFSYYYNDHDPEMGLGEERGTGYAVINNGATYLVVRRISYRDNIFAIYKVLSIESEAVHLIPLDEDNISASRKFYSAEDFTSYVINNSGSAFTYSDKTEFTRASSYTSYKSNNNYNNSQSNSRNVLFTEDYQSFDNNWYSNYNFKDSNYIYIATLDNPDNHYYLFRNRKYKGGYIVPIPFYSIPASYYSIEIEAKHFDGVEDSGYGIKFGASDWNNVYSFNITANGYYRVSKTKNGTYSDIVPWTRTSLLYTGSVTNTMEVRVYASYADMYINGQYVTRLDNFSRFGNNAGLEVYNSQTVHFDNLMITKL